MLRSEFRLLSALLCSLLLTVGCGGDGSGGDGSGGDGSGTASSLWSDYCQATFDRDFEVVDFWGDVTFTARAGESYVVSSFASPSSEEATLFYLTDQGPNEFGVSSADSGFPFSSNCESGAVTSYYGVFDDVTLYTSEDLSVVLCELSAGQVVENTGSTGFSAKTTGLSGPATYEILLGAFSDECAGAQVGYASVPESQIWGITTWLVPIRPLMGAAK